MDPTTLRSFEDELEKIAISATLKRLGVRLLGRAADTWRKGSKATSEGAKSLKDKFVRGTKRQAAGFTGGKNLRPEDDSVLEAIGKLALRPKKTLKSGWGGMGTIERSLFTGMTGYEASKGLRGKNKGEALGRAGGGAIGWIAGRKNPLLSGMATYGLLSSGGGAVGRKASNLANRVRRDA